MAPRAGGRGRRAPVLAALVAVAALAVLNAGAAAAVAAVATDGAGAGEERGSDKARGQLPKEVHEQVAARPRDEDAGNRAGIGAGAAVSAGVVEEEKERGRAREETETDTENETETEAEKEARLETEVEEAGKAAEMRNWEKYLAPGLVEKLRAQRVEADTTARNLSRERARNEGELAQMEAERAAAAVREAELHRRVREEKAMVIHEDLILRDMSARLEQESRAAADPSLAHWVRGRVREVGGVLVGGESGDVLGDVLGDAVEDGIKVVGEMEEWVATKAEQRLHVSHTRAVFLAVIVVSMPAAAMAWAASRLTTVVTLPQRLVIIHIVNAAVAAALVVGYVVVDCDPAALLRYKAGGSYLAACFAALVQGVFVQYIAGHMAAVHPAGSQRRRTYALHAAAYAALYVHVVTVAHPTALRTAAAMAAGQGASKYANFWNYAAYCVATVALLLQVIAAARDGERKDGLAGAVSGKFVTLFQIAAAGLRALSCREAVFNLPQSVVSHAQKGHAGDGNAAVTSGAKNEV